MSDTDLTFYTIPCTREKTWSPNTEKTRLSLNFKGLKYKTVNLEYPEIEPFLSSLGATPIVNGFGVPWTLPALSVGKEVPFVESLNHARFLDKTYPELPTLLPEGAEEAPIHFRELYAGPWQSLFRLLVVAIVTNVLNPPSAEHFRRTKEARFGVSLETVSGEEGSKEREQLWSDLEEGLIPLAALLGDKEGVLFQGHTPTFIDVEFVGFLSWANRSDEAVFHRILKLDPKFKLLWDATPEWRSRTGL